MVYRWLALGVAGVHFAYLAYLVLGGYFAWRWPRTFVLHLMAAAWGVLIIAASLRCPLTWLQNTLRARGGQSELTSSFLSAYLHGVFDPAGREGLARGLLALLLAISWTGLAIRQRREERDRTSCTAGAAGALP
jgi:hypothetical protein